MCNCTSRCGCESPVQNRISSSGCGNNQCNSHLYRHATSNPALLFKELISPTADNTCCNDNVIMYNAVNARGGFNHRRHTSCYVTTTIKEIPAANIYIVNHEFVDLMIDYIVGCFPVDNVEATTATSVKDHVGYYYEYYGNIDSVGNLPLNLAVPLNQNLVVNSADVGRIKAILQALDARLKGTIHGNDN